VGDTIPFAPVLFIDSQQKWVRKDKIAPGGDWSKTGVDGNPTEASATLGRRFMDIEVRVWVDQIRGLIAEHY
jgi:creatinine amidohydrolase/Fe(II)-dependent formamide hydrolase-like protein